MKIRSRDSAGAEKIIEIESLQRVALQPGEKLMIQIDVGTLPPSRAREHMDHVMQFFKSKFPDNTIIVVPSTFKFTVLP